MSESSRLRRVLTPIFSVVTIAALAVAGLAIYKGLERHEANACHVTVRGVTYTLDAEQALHAATITAVGKRLGLPDHAVTIALAAAFQESKLHNLSHGDRDSLGLFQQRPSQGWGTASQVQDPVYAATAFYTHLAKVDGWQTLPVTTAAQKVQLSGAPDAYTNWEAEARAVTSTMTGEVPAAFTCKAAAPTESAVDPALTTAMNAELGPIDLSRTVTAGQGWTVASSLIAHAHQFGITSVTFDGHRWTQPSGRWSLHSPTTARVEFERLPTA